jgi:hypothetical protein
MMRRVIGVMFVSLLALNSFGQLKGDVVRDNRALLTNTEFVIEGSENARLVFNIAVLATGEVSAIKFVPSESTTKRTTSQFDARKYLETFKFEPGTHYPKFHQVTVTITMVKPK